MSKIKKLIGYILYGLLGSWLPHYACGITWKFSKLIRQISGKLLFDNCGKNVDIGRHCKLSSQISLGDNSGIGDNSYIQGKVIIGNNVMMAPNVAIIATNHNIARIDIPMNLQGSVDKEIYIEDDVWIGYGSIILPGVKIAKGSVVGAGSVVTKNVETFTVVGGNPAKIIKKRKMF